MNKYYTYAYLREDRTPYYIGKGAKRRVFEKKTHTTKLPPKDRILFLKQNLTEEEAFKHEIYMIAVFGRKDLGTGILRNRTNGGDGNSGLIHTEESKDKMRKALKGKTAWNKGIKTGPSNFKGKTHKPESIEKIRQKAVGRRANDETKKKMSESRKNRKHTEETKEKIRYAALIREQKKRESTNLE